MKVTQEKQPASRVGLAIEVPAERLKRAYEQVIQKYLREYNFPGFRKGKVPRTFLVQRFGERRLKATALEDVINQCIQQAIEQEKLKTIGDVDLTSSFEELVDTLDFQKPLTFSIAVDVQPEVTLHQYQGFVVQAEEVKPDLTRVDQMLEERRREIATLIPVEDRPAQLDDIATVDFVGRLVASDGAELTEDDQAAREFIEREVTDFQLDMLEDRFIPGFVDGIVGMELNQSKEIVVQFPADYFQAQLANKTVAFTVTLKDLKARELPDLDDNFAQEVSEFETLAELRASLEARVTEEANDRTRSNKENALIAELLKHVEVDLPATMINREVDYLLEQSTMRLQNQGIRIDQLLNSEQMQEFRQQLQPEAVNRLKQRLALREIAKRENITVDPNKLAVTVREYTQAMSDRNVDPELLEIAVREDLVAENVLEWLAAHSTIELVPEGSLTPSSDTETSANLLSSESSTVTADDASPVAETVSQPDENEPASPLADHQPADNHEPVTSSEPNLEASAEEIAGEKAELTPKKKRSKAKPKADQVTEDNS
ncbi:MAG: trigger factor [Cyanobacteria bacterium]|nr:trigger factor [Cyanobacteriota bacterium]MDW8201687.1 trigger factor [Cyanobacteriota bacterium SKYGB_h_bin112]